MIMCAGAGTLSVTLLEKFQAPEWAACRAGVFIALASWGLVPVLHSLTLYNSVPEFILAVRLQIVMGIIYLVRRYICFFLSP